MQTALLISLVVKDRLQILTHSMHVHLGPARVRRARSLLLGFQGLASLREQVASRLWRLLRR